MTNRLEFDGIELMETTQASSDHLIRESPINEARKNILRLGFDRRLKLELTELRSPVMQVYWHIERWIKSLD